ncbi:MAG: NUDIX hydrolase [Leptolyngbya sp. SIO1D8]|nr:NUDIX hydrolase [Leptolyngbya sp. SIO1D8]
MTRWQVRDRFLDLKTRWFTLIGEHWDTEQGKLEYWRVEREDSAVVLPLWADEFLLPKPMYRPGVGQATLDFPGGRIGLGTTPSDAAMQILQRELGISASAVDMLQALNSEGWPINSSFSNQRLYGFVAELRAETVPSVQCQRFPKNAAGMAALSQALICLQCRAVLREWQIQFAGTEVTLPV